MKNTIDWQALARMAYPEARDIRGWGRFATICHLGGITLHLHRTLAMANGALTNMHPNGPTACDGKHGILVIDLDGLQK